jgi:hypothetical protein
MAVFVYTVLFHLNLDKSFPLTASALIFNMCEKNCSKSHEVCDVQAYAEGIMDKMYKFAF